MEREDHLETSIRGDEYGMKAACTEGQQTDDDVFCEDNNDGKTSPLNIEKNEQSLPSHVTVLQSDIIDNQCCRSYHNTTTLLQSPVNHGESGLNPMEEEDCSFTVCPGRQRPVPKPRTSLLKKQSTEKVQTSAETVTTSSYSAEVQSGSCRRRSLYRRNSYQSAVASCLAGLDNTEELGASISGVGAGLCIDPVSAQVVSTGISSSSEGVDNNVNSSIEKGLERKLPYCRPAPPLPAKSPVGELESCAQPTKQLNQTNTDIDSEIQSTVVPKAKRPPPKPAPKPPKQKLESMGLCTGETKSAKIPASISTPNISDHQKMSIDSFAIDAEKLKHHQSSVDIKEKKTKKLRNGSSSSENKVRDKNSDKKQERRRSSQFYYNLDGEEESMPDKSPWWSFGKGVKKQPVRKSVESSSVFYCGVNEGGTLKFEDTKAVGLPCKEKVIRTGDGNTRSEKTIQPQPSDVQSSSSPSTSGQNAAKVLEEYVKKYICEGDDVPKAPPRTKRISRLHEMQKNSSRNLAPDQKNTAHKHSSLSHTAVIDSGSKLHSEHSEISESVGDSQSPSSVVDPNKSVTESVNDASKVSGDLSSSQSSMSGLKEQETDKQHGEACSLLPALVISSETNNRVMSSSDDCDQSAVMVKSPLDDTANVYMPMSVIMPTDLSGTADPGHSPHHSIISNMSSSSEEYISMAPEADNGTVLLRCDGRHDMRPSSWAGPDSDDILCDSKDDNIDTFDLNSSSSDETGDGDGEAQSDLRDTLQSLASIKKKLTQRKNKAFYAAEEIVTSEESFVEVLKLLNEDFRQHVLSAKGPLGGPVVPVKEVDQILKYLPLLQHFSEELLKDLKDRIDNWDNCQKIADVFIEKGPFLKMYSDYIREFESLSACLEEARKRFPEFDKAVAQFEKSPKCSNLAVKHFMLKPVQRIPQYRLLLNEYRKYLDEDSEDYEDSKTALEIVSGVAEHANQSMAMETNIKKLIQIQNSLIGDFEVVKPGRLLVKSGVLKKLCRKEMQSRMFFLFNDTLLCTTPLASGYKLKSELPLDRMKVNKPSKEDFANEFSIITTTRSFRLSASTSEERDEWLKTLHDTVSDYRQKQYSYCLWKTKKLDSVFENDADFKLGKQAPVWVPDSRVSMCTKCHEEFTVTFRRHHCRACGKVFCALCSDNRAPLKYQNYKPGRVCIDCFNYLKAEAASIIQSLQQSEHKEKLMNSMKAFIQSFSRGSTGGYETLWSSFGKGRKKRSCLLQEVKASTDDADTSGYMEIWESKRWKKMWFVLKNKVLYFYRASEDTAAIKSIVLVGFEVQTFKEPFQKVDPSFIFQVIHKNVAPIILKTENESSRDRWLKHMKQAVTP